MIRSKQPITFTGISEDWDILGGFPLVSCPFNTSSVLIGGKTPNASKLYAPAISFTYLTLFFLCIYFFFSVIWYYHKVRIFNRSINHPSVLNTEFAICFLFFALSFLIDFARYSTALPYTIYNHQNDKIDSQFFERQSDGFHNDQDAPFLVSLPIIEAWLLMASVMIRSLACVFFSLGLHQQVLHRSSTIVLMRDPSLSPSNSRRPAQSSSRRSFSRNRIPSSSSSTGSSPHLHPELGSPVDQLRNGRFSYPSAQGESEEQLDISEGNTENTAEQPTSLGIDSHGPEETQIQERRPIREDDRLIRNTSRTRSTSASLMGFHPIPGFGREIPTGPLRQYRNMLISSRLAIPRPSYGSVGGGEDDEEALARLLEEGEGEDEEEEDPSSWSLWSRATRECLALVSSPGLISRVLIDIAVSWPFAIGLTFTIRILTWYFVIDRLAFIDPEQVTMKFHPATIRTNAIANFVTSCLQYLIALALAFQILMMPAAPPTASSESPVRPASRRRRRHGPSWMTRILFPVALLLCSVWFLEPSIMNRWVIQMMSNDDSENGTVLAQSNIESIMCAVPPWWWIGQGTNSTDSTNSLPVDPHNLAHQGPISPFPREIRGWASWTDLYQWMGALGLIVLHSLVRKEYKRNMQEWIWVTVNEVRNTFDFRRS